MKAKLSRFSLITILIFFAGILVMQYSINYDLRQQPPSEEWSKEVLISSGTMNEVTKPFPKLIKFDDKYMAAHQDGSSVKLVVTDKLGKKISEKSYSLPDDLIKYISMVYDGKNIYLYVINMETGGRILTCFKINSSLDVAEKWTKDNADSCAQIGDNIIVTAYADRIEVYDVKTDTRVYKYVSNAKFVSGTLTKNGYMISFQEGNKYFKYFYVKDGITSDIKLAGIMAPDEKGFFEKANLACDDKYGYIYVDVKSGSDRFGTIRYLMFSLDGSESDVKEFRDDQFMRLYNPVAVSSGDEARFIAGSERQYGKKATQFDIVELYMKDGKLIKPSIASRSQEASMYPAISDDTIIYMDSLGSTYNIYMTSKDQDFKNANNYKRPYESKMALSDTLSGFFFSLTYVFVYGIRWLIIGLVGIAAMSYFTYTLNDKNKLRVFTIIYLVTAAIKLYSIYDFFYGDYAFMMPNILASPLLGLIISFIISIPCYLLSLSRYKKDLEALPFISFSLGLLLDTMLTQMVFVPFIA